MRQRFSILIVLSIIVLLFASNTLIAAVPQTINYQGILKTPAGTPVNDTVQMLFALYTVPTGSAPLWSEVQSTVTVTNGRYAVNLGTINPINLSFDSQYYLGVSVGSDPEMLPRQALTSVGYALRAATVQTVPCNTGDFLGCYTGPNGTMGVGACKAGTRTCGPDASFGSCVGEVTPVVEICGDSIDNDCNSVVDNGCPTCSDGIKNGNETAVDCGGSCGATCSDGNACGINGDCISGNCHNQVCATPTCTDAVQNGNETDVDCGGQCDLIGYRCATGKHCGGNNDCQSGYCLSGTCSRKSQGSICSSASECQSFNCVDGYCCDTACNGSCMACSTSKKGSGSNGSCGNISAFTDPDNECSGKFCSGAGYCNP